MISVVKILPIALIINFFFLAFEVKAQSLQHYQKEAANNNPSLTATYYRYLASLQKTNQVSSFPDPELTFGYFITPIETRLGPQHAKISAMQMFPWFGTIAHREKKSVLDAKAKFEVFQEQRNVLFYNMELLWAEIYTVQEQIRIAKENLEILNTLVSTSVIKYETGLVSQIDVLRAQIDLEDLTTKIQELKENKGVLIRRFNEYRAVEGSNEFHNIDSLPNVSNQFLDEQDWLMKIKTVNPQIKRLHYKELEAQAALQIAKNESKPSIGIGIDYIMIGERNDINGLNYNGRDSWGGRLKLKIPISRKKYKAQIKEESLNKLAIQHEITHQVNRLETNFYEAITHLNNAKRRFSLYDEKQIQRIEQAIQILFQSYATDNTEFEEILRLDRQRYVYELERVKALADVYKAASYLRYLSGIHNIKPNEINTK